MQRLFHFSDFHISLNSGMPAENRNFQALLTELGEFKCSDASNYIAFSGDVIDNGYISKQADPNKARKECYELAIDYFRELRDALNVPKENLVFCCGNHDVIRGEYTGAHALCDPAVNYSTVLFSDGYSAFSEFHKKATGRSYSYKAHTYEVGDFLFLSANSTWISKQKDGYIKDEEHRDQMQPQRSRCVDCKGLCAELNRNAVTLASKTACGKSILLVHDPLTSWCENALIDYEGSKPVETRGSEEVYRSLQSLFSYCLCGDKHATAQVADCYIVKTKLDSHEPSFGVINYLDDGTHHYDVYAYKQGRYRCTSMGSDLRDIVEISSKYIKPLSAAFLTGDRNAQVTTEVILQLIKSGPNIDERWELVSDFMKLFASYEKTRANQSAVREMILGNIFARIARDMCAETSTAEWMSVRAVPSQGKSVFLSLEYIYLMRLYRKGALDFIPAYLNLEKIVLLEPDQQRQEICTFLNSAQALGKQMQKPVRYIFDGLNAYSADECSEANCVIEDFLHTNSIHSYITSFDIAPKHTASQTTLSCSRSAKYLLYFSGISPIEKPVQFISAIKLFCELFQRTDMDGLRSRINQLGFGQVNLNLLFRFSDLLTGRCEDMVSLFESYLSGTLHVTRERRKNLIQAAYEIHIKGYCFRQMTVKIERRDYEMLRRQREVSCYLIAEYYYDGILNKKRPASCPVLSEFFQTEENLYLNALFDKFYDETKFKAFIRKYFDKLSCKGKSQFIYLVRNKREILEDIPDQKTDGEQIETENLLRVKITNRTWMVSKGRLDSEAMYSYLSRLLHSAEERHINRITHMYYYGDITFEEADLLFKQAAVFQGFDIYHTYHSLVHRIESLLCNVQNRHILADGEQLILLDMFTLCDMLFFHLHNEQALTRTSAPGEAPNAVPSYFYTSEYYTSAVSPQVVLRKICDLLPQLNQVLKTCTFGETVYDEIKHYFRYAETELNRVCARYNNNPKFHFSGGDFSASKQLNTLAAIARERRIGWNINDTRGEALAYAEIKERLRDVPVKETVLEHIFQTYLIGLFFLPETDASIDGYDKQAILNTILIHDLGESVTGDCPPCAKDHADWKAQENTLLTRLLMMGTVSDQADLSGYLTLWEAWNEKENNNAKIARDLDKIQMAYKYKLLSSSGQLDGFTAERKAEFTHVEPQTALGQKIYRILIG